jgi:hypothetical protein
VAGTVIDGLTPEQEQAVVALLNEQSITKAAQACGTPERTLYSWLDMPPFMKAYRKARRESFSQAVALTQRYAPVAVNALAKVMTDPQSPPAAKVSAASNLLRFGREGIELDDLAARIESLEAALKEKDR